MSNLEGKITLVAGGAGEVGEGVVKALLERGATVVVTSRDKEKLAALRGRTGGPERDRLLTFAGEIGILEGAESIRDTVLDRFGGLDVVVASIGRWWQGAPLTGVSLDTWNTILRNNLTSHFIVARTFLPVLADRPGSSYVFINGDACDVPVPNSGPISIVAAAQLMMKDVVAAELGGQGARVNSLVIGTPVVTRSRKKVEPGWLTAGEIGRYVAYLASSDASHVNGESIHFNDRGQLEKLPG
jgi:NAD(P)-dependent dehydrogenase (short-subunit alcohol dehydrogenase family)